MKAWRYLKASVLQRWRLPVLGEVPVNLAALGIFGVMGFDQPIFWAIGGGFEALWLSLTAGRVAYRRKVDAADRRGTWRAVEEGRLALVGRLSPEARLRHHQLRVACDGLSGREANGRGQANGHALENGRPEAAVELYTWLHLKLLLLRETLTAHAGQGFHPSGRAGAAAGTPDTADLLARALLDIADPAARNAAEQAVSLLESHWHHIHESMERLVRVDTQIVLIETEIATAVGKHRLERAPHDFRHSLALAGDRLRGESASASIDGMGGSLHAGGGGAGGILS